MKLWNHLTLGIVYLLQDSELTTLEMPRHQKAAAFKEHRKALLLQGQNVKDCNNLGRNAL